MTGSDTMVQEDLIRSMETTADEKKAELIARAEKQAADLKADATASADEIRARYRAETAKAVESERNRLLYSVKNGLVKDLSGLRRELFDRAFDMAGKELESIRNSAGYPVCYRELIGEAIGELDMRDVVLHIDSRDSELCARALSELGVGCEVVQDLVCAGGLNASTKDGKVVIYNTIEARLEQAKNHLKLEIYSTLYGD